MGGGIATFHMLITILYHLASPSGHPAPLDFNIECWRIGLMDRLNQLQVRVSILKFSGRRSTHSCSPALEPLSARLVEHRSVCLVVFNVASLTSPFLIAIADSQDIGDLGFITFECSQNQKFDTCAFAQSFPSRKPVVNQS